MVTVDEYPEGDLSHLQPSAFPSWNSWPCPCCGASVVRILVIDELHNVLAGRADVRPEFLNLLRFLGNELCIPLVGVGTREAYLAIRSDDQLENRFEPMTLPLWEVNADMRSLLASFVSSFPLRSRSDIATVDMARYLLTRSEGTIGEMARLRTEAAVAAVDSGEKSINHRTLTMAEYAGPSVRRRKFERDLIRHRPGAGQCTRPRWKGKRSHPG